MNDFQSTLYANLLKLTQERDTFSAKDFPQADGSVIRIFQYRLSSYSDFLQPGAMSARGTMYHVAANGTPLELLALPMEKFFGVNENPMTMKLDLSLDNIQYMANKLDGSLMSSYLFDDELRLKSKAHIASKEARESMRLLNSEAYAPMKEIVVRLTSAGFTVDMEYTGPDNRIVLPYDEDQLSILSLRHRETGEMFMLEEVCPPEEYESIRPYQVKLYEASEIKTLLAGLDEMDRFEGVVICLKSGQRVKEKSLRYLMLHKAQDAISAIDDGGIRDPKKLYNCVVYEQADDLKSMYVNRQDVLDMLDAIEAQVQPKFNGMIAAVEAFHEANRHLDAKAYSLKAQQEAKDFMQLLMLKYRGQAYDYRAFAVKNIPLFCSAAALKPTAMLVERDTVEQV
jgi:T4 RnlA family RNA ligase